MKTSAQIINGMLLFACITCVLAAFQYAYRGLAIMFAWNAGFGALPPLSTSYDNWKAAAALYATALVLFIVTFSRWTSITSSKNHSLNFRHL